MTFSFVFARTVHRNLQYEAAPEIESSAQGNQRRRGECIARATSMFGGLGHERVLMMSKYYNSPGVAPLVSQVYYMDNGQGAIDWGE